MFFLFTAEKHVFVHRKIDISSEAQEVAYYSKQFDSVSFRAYLVIVLKTFKIVTIGIM